MHLHRGKSQQQAAVSAGEAVGVSAAHDPTPDAAIDAVAAILHALAEVANPDSDAPSMLEAWTRHILVLAAPPGSGDAPVSERDWRGMSRQVVAHVRDDHDSASRSMGELQEAVWLVIERLAQAIVGDSAADTEAANQLERLRAAVGSSPEELKATALEAVDRLSEIIDEKSKRQRELARELGERVDVLKGELEHTRRAADIDPLTQVWNRAVFQRELPRARQVSTLVGDPACLVLVDIDHFKQINDVHGHATGDAALEAVSRELVRCFPRRSDIVTRLGGDEFAVILPNATASVGGRLADRFLNSVRELNLAGPRQPVNLTVSIGVAEVLPAESVDRWMARADQALYEAKARGRDGAVVAVDESNAVVQATAAAPANQDAAPVPAGARS